MMKTKIVKLSVLVLAILLLLTSCSPSDANQTAVAQTGFDSPEDAVVAYLEGLRDSSFDRMLGAFAVETYVEHFNLEAYLERLRVYHLHVAPLPDANELTTAMNTEMRRGDVVREIRAQYLILTQSELESTLIPLQIEEGGAGDFIREFSGLLNAPELHTLEILGFIPPENISEIYASEQNQENKARNAQFLGADRLVSRIAVFELDGNKYLLFVEAVSYDDRWYLAQFGGNAGALVALPIGLHGLVNMSYWYADEFFGELLESMIIVESP